MIEIQGKYNEAKIFADTVDQQVIDQVERLLNQEFVKDSQIRIMPDTHVGKGAAIGTTMTIQDKAVPNLVGVDIGCGLEVAIIDESPHDINFDQLDETIRKHVPSGFNIRKKKHPYANKIKFDAIIAPFDRDRAEKSVGTLGGK